MSDKKSFHSKVNGEAFKAIQRTLGAGVTATVVLSAVLSVAFAIVLDGCSNGNKNKKTEVSSSNTNPSSSSFRQALPTPSPVGYVKPVKVTHKKKTIVQSATLSYNDSLSGVSFRYPREYKLITPDNSKPDWGMTEHAAMNFALPGGAPVASIELPKGPATSFFEVNVNKSLTPDQCGEFADPDLSESRSPVSTDEGSIPVKVSLGGVEFTKLETGTQALDTQYYHRYDHGACYEFVMGVSEKPGNTIAVDHWELFDKMEQILATVAIKSNVPTSVASLPVTPNK